MRPEGKGVSVLKYIFSLPVPPPAQATTSKFSFKFRGILISFVLSAFVHIRLENNRLQDHIQ